MGEAPGPDVWSGEGDGDDGAIARPVALQGFGNQRARCSSGLRMWWHRWGFDIQAGAQHPVHP